MAKLCEKYALGYPNVVKLGVDYGDIRKELVNMKGGRNLGVYLIVWYTTEQHQMSKTH